MLAVVSGQALAKAVSHQNAVQVRNMATLKDISIRLKSVKNIQKITKSMKMVSAAKFARAERELRPARPFGEGAQAFYNRVELNDKTPKKADHLMVLLTSDRGLCGGIHTGIAKMVKAELKEKAADSNVKIICVGDKSKMLLQRYYPQHIMMSMNEIGRKPPSFEDASVIAQAIMNSGYKLIKAIFIIIVLKRPFRTRRLNCPSLARRPSLPLKNYRFTTVSTLKFYNPIWNTALPICCSTD